VEKDRPVIQLVVCDAGPLIHLDELEALELLGDFQSVLVPDTVWVEAEAHRPNLFDRMAGAFIRVGPRHPPPASLVALA
jgi:hypothetical protein